MEYVQLEVRHRSPIVIEAYAICQVFRLSGFVQIVAVRIIQEVSGLFFLFIFPFAMVIISIFHSALRFVEKLFLICYNHLITQANLTSRLD